MAEIKIEKKKPIWPWIILALVILALLYFLVFANDDTNDDLDDTNTEQVEEGTAWESDTTFQDNNRTADWDEQNQSGTNQGVDGYLAYISDEQRMGVDHEYTNNALLQLANAVEAKANEVNYDISAEMESIREDARQIQEDPTSTNHANTIKDAGTKLADVIQDMQEEHFPNLSNDAEEVKTAAQNINESTETHQQRDQIKKFFEEAGDVLRKMS